MDYNCSVVAVSRSYVSQMAIIFEQEASFDFRISLVGRVVPIPKLRDSLVFILVFPFQMLDIF
jgi:hypothetical protein